MQHEIFAVKDEKIDFKLPTSDHCVNTMTNVIKLESIDAHVPRKPEPVVKAPDAPVTKLDITQVKETERTLFRSSQQAKIPLKKRDLKLTESYRTNCLNNSSIIVCNPMMTQTKGTSTGEVLSSSVNDLGQTPQESANRRAAPLEPAGKEKGPLGVVGHVGVIRSSFDCHVVPIAKQEEHQVPCLEKQPIIAQEQSSRVRQQSVLVKNVPIQDHVETGSTASALTVVSTAAKQHLPKCDELLSASERNQMFPSSFSRPQSTERPKENIEVVQGLHTAGVELGKENKSEVRCDLVKCDNISKRQELEEASKILPLLGGDGGDGRERTVGKMKADLETSLSPTKVDGGNQKDLDDGITQRLVVQLRSEETKLQSGVRDGPLVEASSELQKEGIRLKIKIPPHRRDKLRGKEGKEKERKPHLQEVWKPLRRSARICRQVQQKPASQDIVCVYSGERPWKVSLQVDQVRVNEGAGTLLATSNDLSPPPTSTDPARRQLKAPGRNQRGTWFCQPRVRKPLERKKMRRTRAVLLRNIQNLNLTVKSSR